MLNKEDLSEIQTITSYNERGFEVNQAIIDGPIMLMPHQQATAWPVKKTSHLTIEDLLCLLNHADTQIDVIIIGTGSISMWPDQAIIDYCHNHSIGIECMPTPAACRTFNILAADSAAVVAGIFPNS